MFHLWGHLRIGSCWLNWSHLPRCFHGQYFGVVSRILWVLCCVASRSCCNTLKNVEIFVLAGSHPFGSHCKFCLSFCERWYKSQFSRSLLSWFASVLFLCSSEDSCRWFKSQFSSLSLCGAGLKLSHACISLQVDWVFCGFIYRFRGSLSLIFFCSKVPLYFLACRDPFS